MDKENSSLSQFITEELHREILGRLKCEFNRPGCIRVAEDWIIKPFNYQKNPACLPCKLKIIKEVKKTLNEKVKNNFKNYAN